MNRYQRIVLAGALVNALVIVLFPPHDVESLLRGEPVFDAFYFAFAAPPNRVINGNLLYLALFAVLVNAALAWVLLAYRGDGQPRVQPGTLVVALGFVDLLLVFLFPPFEAQPLGGRIGAAVFEGFDFAFSSGGRRRVFVPLLYLETVWVLVNACAFWLLLHERMARKAVDASIAELIEEKEQSAGEFEARVAQAVEERIREEARAAGRAAAKLRRGSH